MQAMRKRHSSCPGPSDTPGYPYRSEGCLVVTFRVHWEVSQQIEAVKCASGLSKADLIMLGAGIAQGCQAVIGDGEGAQDGQGGPGGDEVGPLPGRARQWDLQLACVYYRQMVYHGKTHKQAMGAVISPGSWQCFVRGGPMS